jgi:hypothetical protein
LVPEAGPNLLGRSTNQFTLENPLIYTPDNKIRVRAKTIQDAKNVCVRLEYLLVLACQTSKLRNYKKLVYIPRYYMDAREFTQNNLWTVYNSSQSYFAMTTGLKNNYNVYDELSASLPLTFFVKVEGTVRLARRLPYLPDFLESVLQATKSYFAYNATRSIHSASEASVAVEEESKGVLFNADLELYTKLFVTFNGEVQVVETSLVSAPKFFIGHDTALNFYALLDYGQFL